MKKRFIITYLLAFALLWGIGVFYTARVERIGWASLPFDPQMKVTPFWDQVTVFLLRSSTGDSFELVLQTDWERGQDYENHPDRYDDPRYVGDVAIVHTIHDGRVVAPFAHQLDHRFVCKSRLSRQPVFLPRRSQRPRRSPMTQHASGSSRHSSHLSSLNLRLWHRSIATAGHWYCPVRSSSLFRRGS